MSWHPVTRQNPCLICNKSNSGYCMYSDKGEFLCRRVESARSITLKDGDVGWIHPINSHAPAFPKEKERPVPVINVGKLMEQWHSETEWNQIVALAELLGVMPTALGRLGFAWAREHRAWAVPMKNGYGDFCGIRLRTTDGHKFAVRGSHSGIFLPGGEANHMALIVEGPTDASAALSLGFFAIGRPSCSGGMTDCITALRRLRVSYAVIIADADEPGIRGAKMLEQHLPIPNSTLVLPTKDVREFVKFGGTADLLESLIAPLVRNHPRQ